MMRIHPKNLSVGDLFYECEYGYNIEAKVTSAVIKTLTDVFGSYKDHYSWVAVNTQTGEVINYSWTDGVSNTYGPRLYDSPQYVSIVSGEITYDLVGDFK